MPSPTAGHAQASHRVWVADLMPGQRLDDEVFLVSKKDLRTTSNGSNYIHMILSDRTGQLLTRVWQATQQQFESIPDGGFLRVRGRTESYKGALQFIVEGMRPVQQNEVDLADFIPRTKYDVDQMWQETLEILRTLRNPDLQALIKRFVDDRALVEKLKIAPAAVSMHHAYLGGLLEHTLSVLKLACLVFGQTDDSTSHYPEVSRDLVLAGVFLHDIAKTSEFAFDTSFNYTDSGQLIGHIVQSALWIDQKIADVEAESKRPFPVDLQNVLTHIVLSHHGTYEYGSPRLPAVPEAIAVNLLDNLDAKLHMFLRQIDHDADAESRWTQFVPALQTKIFKPDVMGIRRPTEPHG